MELMEHENNNDIMRPLTGKVVRPLFAVVDIESKEDIETTNRHNRENDLPELDEKYSQKGGFERPFLAGYYDGLDFISFKGDDCMKTMLLFLLSPQNDGMTYYAHNGGGFDWLHFLPFLEACGLSFEIMTVQSKIQCLRVKPHKNSHKKGWTFLDSYQLIPASLDKITKSFNTDTKKGNMDYDTHEDDYRWVEYLRDDCISLYQTLLAFYELVEDKLHGEVGMTTAATAMKTYRRSYQSRPIERHSAHHEFFREAYYGGRVEIFREEIKGAHYYDINSSYPYAMLEDMPTGKLVEWEGTPPDWLLEGHYIGFAKANVNVPIDTFIPVLPFRAKDGKLIFPVGKFSGTWTVIELIEAQRQGVTIEWKESKWIESSYIFNAFITTLYEFRNQDYENYDEALSYVSKIMMNSLYGKFATNTKREKIVYISEHDEPPEGAKPVNPEDPECPIYTVEEEINAPYIIPQISAHITAIARLNLFKHMLKCHKSGELAYCDTDAIIGTATLKCSTELGALKDEGNGLIYDGIFLQPKLYYLQGYKKFELLEATDEIKVFDIPKWATHIFITYSTYPDKLGLIEISKSAKINKKIYIPKFTSFYFVSLKIVMKGYHRRTKQDFDTVRLGGSLTYESLEKIGAMVRKGFKEGPKIKTISRCIRTEENKRRHINGITYPIIIDEDIQSYILDDETE